jgi:septum formation protein
MISMNKPPSVPHLILASTSPFRRDLLRRLQLPFDVAAPDVDETALSGEAPEATARRLAFEKAQAVAVRFPDALIIGSDQVAHCATRRFGKPGSLENARIQLRQLSGQTALFETGLCVLNAASGRAQIRVVATEVRFRNLTDEQIERYLGCEDVLNCAGSAKAEGLGITLLESLSGSDPNALIGLPLIALCEMLRNESIALP